MLFPRCLSRAKLVHSLSQWQSRDRGAGTTPSSIFQWGFSQSPSEIACRESDVLRRSFTAALGIGVGPNSVRSVAVYVMPCTI